MKLSDDSPAGSTDRARRSPQDSPGPDPASRRAGSGGAPADGREDDAARRAAPASSGGLIQILQHFAEELIGSADSLMEVYADRARLSMRRAAVQVALGAGLAICVAVWLGAAALAVLRGICGGLAAVWGGREWLGDLTGGLLALALAAGAIAIHLRLSARRELRRLKAKYEQRRNEHSKNDDTATPAGDSRGTA